MFKELHQKNWFYLRISIIIVSNAKPSTTDFSQRVVFELHIIYYAFNIP